MTKLYIPPSRPGLVPRPRLIQRLDESLQLGRKLTVISAPAGFGKTTLVSEWLTGLRLAAAKEDQIADRIAWLSLDESDNNGARFLAYFIAALQTIETRQESVGNIGQGALSALQSPQPPPAEAILTSLINEITAVPGRILLVLDDYHLIEAQPIHDGLTFLLEHLPPQMHLVIATRDDPHLPLARLRARGQLTEVRAAGMLLFRGALEGVSYFVTTIVLLTMVAFGAESLAAGADVPALQSIANALYRAMGIFGHTGTMLFITGAVCLYISFYRTRLIPRWLTIWGLIGTVPFLANALLHFFQVETGLGIYLDIPLAIQELVMGAWLVIAGFNKDAVRKLDEAH